MEIFDLWNKFASKIFTLSTNLTVYLETVTKFRIRGSALRLIHTPSWRVYTCSLYVLILNFVRVASTNSVSTEQKENCVSTINRDVLNHGRERIYL
jgi:hypothetical protein